MPNSDNENQYKYGAYDYRTQNEDDQRHREEQRRRDEEDARSRQIEEERLRVERQQEQEQADQREKNQREQAERQQQAQNKTQNQTKGAASQSKTGTETPKQTDFDDFLDLIITVCGGIVGFFIADKQGFSSDIEPLKFFGIIAIGAVGTYTFREIFRFIIKLGLFIAVIFVLYVYVWPTIVPFIR